MSTCLLCVRQQLTFLLVNDAANSARAHWDFQHDVFDNYMKPLVDGYLQQVAREMWLRGVTLSCSDFRH